MVITLTSRKDYGFLNDNFPGFIILDGQVPAAQIHFFPNHYTFFWRGSVYMRAIEEFLIDLIRQISNNHNVPLEKLNSCSASYDWSGDLKTIDFVIQPMNEKQNNVYKAHADALKNWSQLHRLPPSFAKFDFQAGVPIILWADLTDGLYYSQGDQSPEIGFSSTIMTPPAILQLLYTTCEARLDSSEVEAVRLIIARLIRQYTKVFKWQALGRP
jgi:hypothetical protein